MRANRIQWLAVLFGAVAGVLSAADATSAAARQQLRTITYHGYRVTVPRSWPVYDLARAPHTCVRFDRHALYLGVPGTEQRCPAQPVGRTEAILIEPAGAVAARASAGEAAAEPLEGSATMFIVRSSDIEVIATWLNDRQLISAALHRRTLPVPRASERRPRLGARIARSGGGGARLASAPTVYTGPGFDACDAPSSQQMSAWTAYSPYHAIGVYIGGANAACPPSSDPNLTTTWLGNEAGAGWHFIPTYVGLQAPSNSCGCTPINPTQASAEGTAAADDAVNQAQSLGLPSGSPIYDDMEYYSRTQANTSAVLAFLAAWTTELHAKGYLSGVYGNANSAIADLVTQAGTNYPEPDDIWFAAWPGDGSQSTSDPNIPSDDWSNHQRIHQWRGGHNETYGGVTLDIDSDYLDGATADTIVAPNGPFPPPTLSVSPAGTMTNLTASWSGLGQSGWQVLAGTSPTALTTVASAALQGAQTKIAIRTAAPYFAVQAMGPSGQVLATSPTVATPTRLELFGHSSFFGESSEVGAVPIGCYLATACQLVATISVGRTRLTRTRPQTFRSGGSGILYYRLNSTGRRLLARARDARLPVQVTVKDASGASVGANMVLIPFMTSGRGPLRSLSPGPVVGAVGTTDYVWGGWSGGILTRCSTASACWITGTLSVGRTTIGSIAPQLVGGVELGYVFFSLTRRGHELLRQARGNQLATNLLLRSGTSVASARIVLAQFA